MSQPRSQRLVGRGRELAQLDASLERALEGRGGLILLTGEPGIGKTALAREFVEHAATRGAAWAWGSCWDGGGAPAYWPWVQVGRVLSRRADLPALRAALAEGAPWIAGLLPELASTLGPAAETSELDSDQARFRLFDALATLLATVADQRPLVIVLDDLHWADASSLMALEFIARALPDMPLLAIAAYRHAEAHARPDLAAPLGGLARAATRLPLEGLGREEVRQLAEARARGLGEPDGMEGSSRGRRAPIAPRLVLAVHQASGGNPFFVDELVQLLAAQGRLHDDRAATRPLPLPDGVRDAIRRRLDPLEPFVHQALCAAAVIGGEFGLHTLATVLDEPPSAVLEWLEVPLRSGIVTVARDAGRYAFAHALVRDTLLESLGATRRARLHRVAAEALEAAYSHDLEQHLAEIAHHYLHAATEGGAERAVDYAARAAQRAVVQFAYEEAARLYERAIDVAASLPADEQTAWRLAQGLGEARMRAGDVYAAHHALRVAAEHARRLDDAECLAQTALAGTLGTFSPGLVEPELVSLLEEALRRLEEGGSEEQDLLRRATIDALRCRLRVQLALALYWSPQRPRREQLVDEALGLARALYTGAARDARAQRTLGDRTLAFALAQGFVAVWGPDTVTRGLPISIEALELCERTNDAELGMQVRLWRISLLLELDDPVRADEEIEAFGTTARRLGQPRMLVYDPLHRAMAAHMRGDFVASERYTAQALAQARDVPGSIAPIIADAQTFLVRRTQGRHLDLEPLVRRNADRLPAMRRWRCGLALVLAELGREDEARRELEQLAAQSFDDVPRDALWLVAMSLLAELCALLGDRPRARRLYGLLVPYEGRNVVSMGAAYLGPVARYLGLLAMTLGEDERALAHLETARSAAERMGARPTVVLTALDAAEVLARRDGRDDAQRARALVQRVSPDAVQMKMDGAIARADDLLARLEDAAGAAGAGRARASRGLARAQPLHAALRREQDVWLLDYDGRSVCLQDAKGLHHLATLFSSPGTAIASVDLAGATRGAAGARGTTAVDGAGMVSYRARATDLREELDEALAFNDPERIARAREQLERLAVDVAAADVSTTAAGERARINVTRAIKAAVRRIAEHEPELGHLLRGTVRTGTSCAYEPDPGVPLQWEVHR
ncbi:MAG TPA: AAA family ATPase [Solirubrobacteraceae bacterium]|nr:AAA family ATPase [Solirubrobacteraceae bacterium]